MRLGSYVETKLYRISLQLVKALRLHPKSRMELQEDF